MFMSSMQAAAELGMTDRQVRRVVDAGHIQAERIAGRLALYENQVLSYKHAHAQGRQWLDSTRLAALDMLSGIETERLTGSQKSRLKARIRGMDSNALARRILGHTVSMYDAGASEAAIDSALADELNLVGEWTKVLVARNSKREAAKRRLVSNPNGRVAIIEGDAEHRRALEAFALYSFGDTRERTAAAGWLQRQRAAI